ncbi:MAG: TIGR04283 family arsenosugar biosynthesis glycosyltransferase [Gemmatimonadetes bacterium]|nr:TIGR04283 family arsenosugar biosynthesis glycosyltransferase [Gemmatimonadota bacterium]
MTELAVVIPTLNEARTLPRLLEDLAGLDLATEIVVADGGSVDGTPAIAQEAGARVVRAPAGRASQLNAGAAAVAAPWLAFLHADTRLGREARDALSLWLRAADPRIAAVFGFRLDGDGWFWRLIEVGQRLRERIYRLPYGDQGLVISRQLFDAVGGYPALPLLEDVEMLRRVRRHGRLVGLPAPLVTSPRRYEREGRWRGWVRNAALVSLYFAGVAPERLARWYRPEPPPRRVLLVFAKAPDPGRVKTRLAADLGAQAAAELYRTLGRRVFDQVRDGPYEVVVCYDPPSAEARVREWLAAPKHTRFEPQAGGDLGARLRDAFDAAFAGGASAVCAIGTDVPALDRAVVGRAFRTLASHDVVFGPALDGGYYLVGLAARRPELFHGIPWSTATVLEASRAAAGRLGLRIAELQPLADVDTPRDLP